ncbi:CFA97-like protein [Mya arenaria]|uniref:CFA97-like protein n=2 Tax=Mya arenaria TaxID=6604 RepID=A0ABY7DQH7_MYAAR|nr:CFA97-like protein [Mya arenaria]
MPSAHVDAWSDKAKQSSEKNIPETKTKTRRNPRKRDSSSDSYSSDGSVHRQKDRISRNDRVKSAKSRNGRTASDKTHKHRLRSASSSYSNNSDITDVSPLESPENTPRRKKNIQQTSENGHFEKVQYRDASPLNESADIKLENEQIDLSILMKCMADIDREKQQRIKTNSRRVMFAPPTNEKQKGNFSFSVNRANIIEKENQRLLNKIMTQMKSSGPVKKTTTISSKGPRKATEPVIQRLTPSAVNRMREQRRIEAENMHILNRLHSVKPTQGMSRQDQIGQFERQMSYGIPSGTMLITEPRLETRARSHTSLDHSSVPFQRSRPSSASSLGITTQGKRSRPSSAKSNASIRSNASVRSTASKRSTMSMRSNFSIGSVKRRSDKVDCRPEWNDRFSCA